MGRKIGVFIISFILAIPASWLLLQFYYMGRDCTGGELACIEGVLYYFVLVIILTPLIFTILYKIGF